MSIKLYSIYGIQFSLYEYWLCSVFKLCSQKEKQNAQD